MTGSAEAATLLSHGEVDLALVFDIRVPRNARHIASAALPLGVVVAPGSRQIRHEGRLRVYDLTGERVVISDSSLSLGSSVEGLFGTSHVKFPPCRNQLHRADDRPFDARPWHHHADAAAGGASDLAWRSGVHSAVRPQLQPPRLHLLSRPKTELSDAATALSAAFALAIKGLGT
ncbi:MAG: hypothetical protein H7245_01620 [Candidatus Saccharibacteria bacterium]|nr:hypothetical protein [Pseudorhodobacter sp.]